MNKNCSIKRLQSTSKNFFIFYVVVLAFFLLVLAFASIERLVNYIRNKNKTKTQCGWDPHCNGIKLSTTIVLVVLILLFTLANTIFLWYLDFKINCILFGNKNI